MAVVEYVLREYELDCEGNCVGARSLDRAWVSFIFSILTNFAGEWQFATLRRG